MDYVDWCLRVLRSVNDTARESIEARAIGVSNLEIELKIFTQPAAWNSAEQEAIFDALRDLKNAGLLTSHDSTYYQLTDSGRQALDNPIPGWESICSAHLQPDQQELLATVNRLSQEPHGDIVRVRDVPGSEIVTVLTWANEILRLQTVTTELKQKQLIHAVQTMGNMPDCVTAHAIYRGVVWETRRKFTRQSRWIDQLVREWETTSVEFRRDINLATRDEEAEFAKDILGLVNTQASGNRLLIVGFDPRTHRYVGPPNPKLSQDWIERTLTNDTDPMVNVQYSVVEYRDGLVGVIVVTRDSTKLPHLARRSIGDKKRIHENKTYVRHGSQTEEPTPNELQALIEEGKRARGELTIEAQGEAVTSSDAELPPPDDPDIPTES